MSFFFAEPEVAGAIGDHSIIERRASHPHNTVTKLQYVFQGWLGDQILESFPVFIVTRQLAIKLQTVDASGVLFDDVEIGTYEEFHQWHPDLELPEFRWLKVTGEAGVDDFGIAGDRRLVVSGRIRELLEWIGTAYCTFDEYTE